MVFGVVAALDFNAQTTAVDALWAYVPIVTFPSDRFPPPLPTLEATQGQIDAFFSQLPFKRYLPEIVSVGYGLVICPWVASRVVSLSWKSK